MLWYSSNKVECRALDSLPIITLLQESKLLTKIHCHCNSQQSDQVPVDSFCHQAAKGNTVQLACHFDPI